MKRKQKHDRNKETGTLHDLIKPEPHEFIFPTLARQEAAKAWCDYRTAKKMMDPVLCEVFAEILDKAMQQPSLGCATTGQMLTEIGARVNLNYSTVFWEEPKCPAPVEAHGKGRRIFRKSRFDRWLRDCAEFAMQSEWMIDPQMPDWFTWYCAGLSPKLAVETLFSIIRKAS